MDKLRILPLSELSPAAHRQAVELYWQAFEGKLGRLLGPRERALRLIASVMQPDHGFAVLSPQGDVVGVAGFRSPRGGFVPLLPSAIRREYGRFGAWWRLAALYLISEAPDPDRFLIEGLAVHPDWRSRGLGSRLITALSHEARLHGYPALRLDVAEQNTRARALYERLGFHTIERQSHWHLAPIFRMTGSRAMELRL